MEVPEALIGVKGGISEGEAEGEAEEEAEKVVMPRRGLRCREASHNDDEDFDDLGQA